MKIIKKSIVAIAFIAVSGRCLAGQYNFVPLSSYAGSPDAPYTYLTGIDLRGAFVGYTAGTGTGDNGFIYRRGAFSQEGPAASPNGYDRPTGMSESGLVVGFAATLNGPEFGYEIASGQQTTVTLPDGTPTFPLGVNNRGQIVGVTQISGASGGFWLSGNQVLAINYPGARTTIPSAINDRAEIVGTYTDSVGAHGFLFAAGAYSSFDVPGSMPGTTVANGLNNRNEIVGSFEDKTGQQVGFISRNGKYVHIAYPGPGLGTSLSAINNKGVIVGQYVTSRGGQYNYFAGFVATPVQ